jgi:hypothetical protein
MMARAAFYHGMEIISQFIKEDNPMKQAQIKTLTPGTVIRYRERAAIVLEQTGAGALVQLLDGIERQKYGKTNDWRSSPIRAYLNGEFARQLCEGNMDELLDTVTDLTALDGGKEYGASTDKVTLLTLDQCRKFRYIRPMPEGVEWTSTPDCTPAGWDKDAELVVVLHTNGSINNNYCTNTCGARPAFTLPSSLSVGVPGGCGLEDFTDAELLSELLKRRQDE